MSAVPGARFAGVAQVCITFECRPILHGRSLPLKRHDSGLTGDVELCSQLE